MPPSDPQRRSGAREAHWLNLANLAGEHGATYAVTVPEDWLSPAIQQGDVLLISPSSLYEPGDIVIVRHDGRYSLRRVEESVRGCTRFVSDHAGRYPDIVTTPNASVVGIAVGHLYFDRPLSGRRNTPEPTESD